MKHNKKTEKKVAVEASEEIHTDKTMGVEVETPEVEKTDEQTSEIEQLQKQLEEMTKQSEENFNRFLRMQADFENYKKRTAREREELFFTSLENIMKELLPVIDNMERAVASFRDSGLDSSFVDGVDMIQKQFIKVLEKYGLKEIEAKGMEFDPNVHHAVMQVPGEAEEENKVKEVLQKGYFLGPKVIRPAMVQVVVNN